MLTSAAVGPTAADPDSHAESHDEIVKVLDFGIAKMINADDPNPMSVVETQAGTVFGTPRYMSPEQAQGKPLDARSDLYSLAVILYQMLTGRPPFTDNDAVVVMARHIKSTPKRPNEAVPEAMIPTELEDVIMRTLSKEPKDRPGSAEIFAGELLAALEAQGAQTSGVRASITNAAGIRVPESMRPPPMALPKPPSRSKLPLVLLAVPLVVLAAAGGVYLGMSRRAQPVTPSPTRSATARATRPTRTARTRPARPRARPASAPPTAEPPTVTPDSLPRAPSATAPPVASGKHGKPGTPHEADQGKRDRAARREQVRHPHRRRPRRRPTGSSSRRGQAVRRDGGAPEIPRKSARLTPTFNCSLRAARW